MFNNQNVYNALQQEQPAKLLQFTPVSAKYVIVSGQDETPWRGTSLRYKVLGGRGMITTTAL